MSRITVYRNKKGTAKGRMRCHHKQVASVEAGIGCACRSPTKFTLNITKDGKGRRTRACAACTIRRRIFTCSNRMCCDAAFVATPS